jgi:hypothetical protein
MDPMLVCQRHPIPFEQKVVLLTVRGMRSPPLLPGERRETDLDRAIAHAPRHVNAPNRCGVVLVGHAPPTASTEKARSFAL